eukprot:3299536-Prymnesium_polylepis.3
MSAEATGMVLQEKVGAQQVSVTCFGFGKRVSLLQIMRFALAGSFLFFVFFGCSLLISLLVVEALYFAYHIRSQKKLRRLRYSGTTDPTNQPVSR